MIERWVTFKVFRHQQYMTPIKLDYEKQNPLCTDPGFKRIHARFKERGYHQFQRAG